MVGGVFFLIFTSLPILLDINKSMNLDIIIKHGRQSDVGSAAYHNENRQHCLFWGQNEIIPNDPTMNIKAFTAVFIMKFKGNDHIL